ncbi:MAG: 16S rRNA (guanine(527)-N(7))-methyltransferase RsmG [Candidatus Binatus sp.]|uniref:16S rRNA (guanine(527)-N(7))-methyltransferase RsmG n=1 Tax=Candidatus Binatus sp. TaxID=2811406 RepID=UPI0027259943|nr:16S rRNA (guanine(527)-N(7))-methyltransferase RsmG [Candidatus Binatus sp.]MDO8433202.1 16S rRNA (guanine(527)-N(7))-methyltransferase RsmG [Candidatus Binatus sp.]
MKKAVKEKMVDPAKIGAEVRARIAPALPGIGIIAKNQQFLDRIEHLATTLALWGPKINLTANPTDPDEIVFHIFDSLIPISLAVAGKVLKLRAPSEPERRIADIGSGAGFPGLVIAAALNAHVTLIESRRKRATFLEAAAMEMELRDVTVEGRRAEEVGSAPGGFDLVTARAVGRPGELFAVAARLLHPGGLLMLYAGGSTRFDRAEAVAAGLVENTVLDYDLRHGKSESRRVAVVWTRH